MGEPLDFVRTYNSQSRVFLEPDSGNPDPVQIDIGLGVGWTHSFSDRLIYWGKADDTQSQPDLIWYSSDGASHFFAYENGTSGVDKGYHTPPELSGQMIYLNQPNDSNLNDDRYVFVASDGTEYHFVATDFDNGGNDKGDVRALLQEESR